jgi:hypothetical protein
MSLMQGVAGVRARPLLRGRMTRDHERHQQPVLPGFRSRPSLRASSRPAAAAGHHGIAGARPRPSLRVRPQDSRRPRWCRSCRARPVPRCAYVVSASGFTLELVGVAGVRPRPSLRVRPGCFRRHLRSGVAEVLPLPSWRVRRVQRRHPGRAGGHCRVWPGPRCAQLPQIWSQVANAALPGFRPALIVQPWCFLICSSCRVGIAGVRPWPSLRGH